jgi:glycosyltransferase involved in cell wall biosynthesis
MRVSAILTCHNEGAFIAEAVRSVSNQTARDQLAEIIVVNDGSTDDSASVLEGLTREEQLLRVITTRGIKLPAARNLAISEARGDVIALSTVTRLG